MESLEPGSSQDRRRREAHELLSGLATMCEFQLLGLLAKSEPPSSSALAAAGRLFRTVEYGFRTLDRTGLLLGLDARVPRPPHLKALLEELKPKVAALEMEGDFGSELPASVCKNGATRRGKLRIR